jgi:sarcosine oxidase
METFVSKMGLHFVDGKHPAHGRVNIACDLGGHGFKFAGVPGGVLAQLALDGASGLPIGFLSPMRFGRLH